MLALVLSPGADKGSSSVLEALRAAQAPHLEASYAACRGLLYSALEKLMVADAAFSPWADDVAAVVLRGAMHEESSKLRETACSLLRNILTRFPTSQVAVGEEAYSALWAQLRDGRFASAQGQAGEVLALLGVIVLRQGDCTTAGDAKVLLAHCIHALQREMGTSSGAASAFSTTHAGPRMQVIWGAFHATTSLLTAHPSLVCKTTDAGAAAAQSVYTLAFQQGTTLPEHVKRFSALEAAVELVRRHARLFKHLLCSTDGPRCWVRLLRLVHTKHKYLAAGAQAAAMAVTEAIADASTAQTEGDRPPQSVISEVYRALCANLLLMVQGQPAIAPGDEGSTVPADSWLYKPSADLNLALHGIGALAPLVVSIDGPDAAASLVPVLLKAAAGVGGESSKPRHGSTRHGMARTPHVSTACAALHAAACLLFTLPERHVAAGVWTEVSTCLHKLTVLFPTLFSVGRSPRHAVVQAILMSFLAAREHSDALLSLSKAWTSSVLAVASHPGHFAAELSRCTGQSTAAAPTFSHPVTGEPETSPAFEYGVLIAEVVHPSASGSLGILKATLRRLGCQSTSQAMKAVAKTVSVALCRELHVTLAAVNLGVTVAEAQQGADPDAVEVLLASVRTSGMDAALPKTESGAASSHTIVPLKPTDMITFVGLADCFCTFLPMVPGALWASVAPDLLSVACRQARRFPHVGGLYTLVSAIVATSHQGGVFQGMAASAASQVRSACRAVAQLASATAVACAYHAPSLQVASVGFLLRLPQPVFEIAGSSADSIASIRLSACLAALRLGLSAAGLMGQAVASLQRWQATDPASLSAHLPELLPLLKPLVLSEGQADPGMDVAAEGDSTSRGLSSGVQRARRTAAGAQLAQQFDKLKASMEDSLVKAFGQGILLGGGSAEHKALFPRETDAVLDASSAAPGLAHFTGQDSTSTAEATLQELRVCVFHFLGMLGSSAGLLEGELQAAAADAAAWGDCADPSSSQALEFTVNLGSEELRLPLARLFPQAVAAAQGAPTRSARVAALELVHAMFLSMLGQMAHHSGSMAFPDTWARTLSRVTSHVVEFAASGERVACQLFEPLLQQQAAFLAHAWGKETRWRSAGKDFLDLLLGLSKAKDPRVQQVVAAAMAQAVRWGIKSTTEQALEQGLSGRQSGSTPFALAAVQCLVAAAEHPLPQCRLVGANAFAQCYCVFGKEIPLALKFSVPLARSFLAACIAEPRHTTAIASDEVHAAVSTALSRLKRILVEYAPSLQEESTELLEFCCQLLSHEQSAVRTQAIRMLDALEPEVHRKPALFQTAGRSTPRGEASCRVFVEAFERGAFAGPFALKCLSWAPAVSSEFQLGIFRAESKAWPVSDLRSLVTAASSALHCFALALRRKWLTVHEILDLATRVEEGGAAASSPSRTTSRLLPVISSLLHVQAPSRCSQPGSPESSQRLVARLYFYICQLLQEALQGPDHSTLFVAQELESCGFLSAALVRDLLLVAAMPEVVGADCLDPLARKRMPGEVRCVLELLSSAGMSSLLSQGLHQASSLAAAHFAQELPSSMCMAPVLEVYFDAGLGDLVKDQAPLLLSGAGSAEAALLAACVQYITSQTEPRQGPAHSALKCSLLLGCPLIDEGTPEGSCSSLLGALLSTSPAGVGEVGACTRGGLMRAFAADSRECYSALCSEKHLPSVTAALRAVYSAGWRTESMLALSSIAVLRGMLAFAQDVYAPQSPAAAASAQGALAAAEDIALACFKVLGPAIEGLSTGAMVDGGLERGREVIGLLSSALRLAPRVLAEPGMEQAGDFPLLGFENFMGSVLSHSSFPCSLKSLFVQELGQYLLPGYAACSPLHVRPEHLEAASAVPADRDLPMLPLATVEGLSAIPRKFFDLLGDALHQHLPVDHRVLAGTASESAEVADATELAVRFLELFAFNGALSLLPLLCSMFLRQAPSSPLSATLDDCLHTAAANLPTSGPMADHVLSCLCRVCLVGLTDPFEGSDVAGTGHADLLDPVVLDRYYSASPGSAAWVAQPHVRVAVCQRLLVPFLQRMAQSRQTAAQAFTSTEVMVNVGMVPPRQALQGWPGTASSRLTRAALRASVEEGQPLFHDGSTASGNWCLLSFLYRIITSTRLPEGARIALDALLRGESSQGTAVHLAEYVASATVAWNLVGVLYEGPARWKGARQMWARALGQSGKDETFLLTLVIKIACNQWLAGHELALDMSARGQQPLPREASDAARFSTLYSLRTHLFRAVYSALIIALHRTQDKSKFFHKRLFSPAQGATPGWLWECVADGAWAAGQDGGEALLLVKGDPGVWDAAHAPLKADVSVSHEWVVVPSDAWLPCMPWVEPESGQRPDHLSRRLWRGFRLLEELRNSQLQIGGTARQLGSNMFGAPAWMGRSQQADSPVPSSPSMTTSGAGGSSPQAGEEDVTLSLQDHVDELAEDLSRSTAQGLRWELSSHGVNPVLLLMVRVLDWMTDSFALEERWVPIFETDATPPERAYANGYLEGNVADPEGASDEEARKQAKGRLTRVLPAESRQMPAFMERLHAAIASTSLSLRGRLAAAQLLVLRPLLFAPWAQQWTKPLLRLLRDLCALPVSTGMVPFNVHVHDLAELFVKWDAGRPADAEDVAAAQAVLQTLISATPQRVALLWQRKLHVVKQLIGIWTSPVHPAAAQVSHVAGLPLWQHVRIRKTDVFDAFQERDGKSSGYLSFADRTLATQMAVLACLVRWRVPVFDPTFDARPDLNMWAVSDMASALTATLRARDRMAREVYMRTAELIGLMAAQIHFQPPAPSVSWSELYPQDSFAKVQRSVTETLVALHNKPPKRDRGFRTRFIECARMLGQHCPQLIDSVRVSQALAVLGHVEPWQRARQGRCIMDIFASYLKTDCSVQDALVLLRGHLGVLFRPSTNASLQARVLTVLADACRSHGLDETYLHNVFPSSHTGGTEGAALHSLLTNRDLACRAALMDLAFAVAKRSDLDGSAVQAAALRVLLAGTQDADEALREQVLRFWDAEAGLSESASVRWLQVVGFASWPCQASTWSQIACTLLLRPAMASPTELQTCMTTQVLWEDCKFKQQGVDTGWVSGSGERALAQSLVRGSQAQEAQHLLRATVAEENAEGALFSATLPTDAGGAYRSVGGGTFAVRDEFTMQAYDDVPADRPRASGPRPEHLASARDIAAATLQDQRELPSIVSDLRSSASLYARAASSGPAPVSAAGALQQADASRVLRVRFGGAETSQRDESDEQSREPHWRRALQTRQRKRAAQRSAQASAGRVVALFRQYRAGDFPDVQAKRGDLLRPLMSLCSTDPLMAQCLLRYTALALYTTQPKRGGPALNRTAIGRHVLRSSLRAISVKASKGPSFLGGNAAAKGTLTCLMHLSRDAAQAEADPACTLLDASTGMSEEPAHAARQDSADVVLEAPSGGQGLAGLQESGAGTTCQAELQGCIARSQLWIDLPPPPLDHLALPNAFPLGVAEITSATAGLGLEHEVLAYFESGLRVSGQDGTFDGVGGGSASLVRQGSALSLLSQSLNPSGSLGAASVRQSARQATADSATPSTRARRSRRSASMPRQQQARITARLPQRSFPNPAEACSARQAVAQLFADMSDPDSAAGAATTVLGSEASRLGASAEACGHFVLAAGVYTKAIEAQQTLESHPTAPGMLVVSQPRTDTVLVTPPAASKLGLPSWTRHVCLWDQGDALSVDEVSWWEDRYLHSLEQLGDWAGVSEGVHATLDRALKEEVEDALGESSVEGTHTLGGNPLYPFLWGGNVDVVVDGQRQSLVPSAPHGGVQRLALLVQAMARGGGMQSQLSQVQSVAAASPVVSSWMEQHSHLFLALAAMQAGSVGEVSSHLNSWRGSATWALTNIQAFSNADKTCRLLDACRRVASVAAKHPQRGSALLPLVQRGVEVLAHSHTHCGELLLLEFQQAGLSSLSSAVSAAVASMPPGSEAAAGCRGALETLAGAVAAAQQRTLAAHFRSGKVFPALAFIHRTDCSVDASNLAQACRALSKFALEDGCPSVALELRTLGMQNGLRAVTSVRDAGVLPRLSQFAQLAHDFCVHPAQPASAQAAVRIAYWGLRSAACGDLSMVQSLTHQSDWTSVWGEVIQTGVPAPVLMSCETAGFASPPAASPLARLQSLDSPNPQTADSSPGAADSGSWLPFVAFLTDCLDRVEAGRSLARRGPFASDSKLKRARTDSLNSMAGAGTIGNSKHIAELLSLALGMPLPDVHPWLGGQFSAAVLAALGKGHTAVLPYLPRVISMLLAFPVTCLPVWQSLADTVPPSAWLTALESLVSFTAFAVQRVPPQPRMLGRGPPSSPTSTATAVEGALQAPHKAVAALSYQLLRVAAAFPHACVFPVLVAAQGMNLGRDDPRWAPRINAQTSPGGSEFLLPIVQLLCRAAPLAENVVVASRDLYPLQLRVSDACKAVSTAMRGDEGQAADIFEEFLKDMLPMERHEERCDSSHGLGAVKTKVAQALRGKHREGAVISTATLEAMRIIAGQKKSSAELVRLVQAASPPPGQHRLRDFSAWLADYDGRLHPVSEAWKLPNQSTRNSDAAPAFASSQVRVMTLESKALFLDSKQRPARLGLVGDDGQRHRFLAKAGEDMRMDQRVEDAFGAMNAEVQKGHSSRSAALQVHQLLVTPTSTSGGFMQWLEGGETMDARVTQELDASHPGLIPGGSVQSAVMKGTAPGCDVLQRMRGSGQAPLATRIGRLFEKSDDTVAAAYDQAAAAIPSTSLQRMVARLAPDGRTLHWLRRQLAGSLAATNACSYLLGIGDRHLRNIMLVPSKGMVVPIDFGYSFGIGATKLPVIETYCIRLTPSLRAMLAPLHTGRSLVLPMARVMGALQDSSQTLLATLQPFILDPVMEWELHAAQLSDKLLQSGGQEALARVQQGTAASTGSEATTGADVQLGASGTLIVSTIQSAASSSTVGGVKRGRSRGAISFDMPDAPGDCEGAPTEVWEGHTETSVDGAAAAVFSPQAQLEATWYPQLMLRRVEAKLKRVNPAAILADEVQDNSQFPRAAGQRAVRCALQAIAGAERADCLRARPSCNEGPLRKCEDVQQQMECLVELATDSALLARAWIGLCTHI